MKRLKKLKFKLTSIRKLTLVEQETVAAGAGRVTMPSRCGGNCNTTMSNLDECNYPSAVPTCQLTCLASCAGSCQESCQANCISARICQTDRCNPSRIC